MVQSEPVVEPEAENETSQEVFLKCLGLGGKWIQMGDRVVDKDAFYSSSENENVSNLDIQDSTVSTVVLEQEEVSGEENPVTDLPGSPETATNTSELYDLGTSHNTYRGLDDTDDADDAMEESNKESGIETVDGMSSDGGN